MSNRIKPGLMRRLCQAKSMGKMPIDISNIKSIPEEL